MQLKQTSGKVQKTSGNVDNEYQFNENDQDYVHVKITTRSWNEAKQDADVSSVVKKFHPEVFETLKEQLGGTSVEVLHDPRRPSTKVSEDSEEAQKPKAKGKKTKQEETPQEEGEGEQVAEGESQKNQSEQS